MKKLLLLPVLLLCLPALSQTFQRYNLNYLDIALYNPAAANSAPDRDLLVANFDIDTPDAYGDAPTHLIDYSSKSYKSGSLIMSLSRDRYYWFSNYKLSGGYAFGIDTDGQRLNIGATASLDFDRVNWSLAPVYTGYTGNRLYVLPDVNIGIEYCFNGFHIGVAVMNALSVPFRKEGELLLQNPRMLTAHTSLDLYLDSARLQFSPYALVVYDGIDGSLDAGLFTRWSNMVSASYAFRTYESRNLVTVGFMVPTTNLEFHVGYSWSSIVDQKSVTLSLISFL